MIGKHISDKRRAAIAAAYAENPNIKAVAQKMGASLSTVRRIRDNIAPAARPVQAAPTLAEHRTITRLRDEVAALQRQLKESHRSSLDDERIVRILGGMADWRAAPPGWLITPPPRKKNRTAEVPVLVLSDWHYGEVVHASETRGVNAFDTDIAKARVRRVVESVIRIARDFGPGTYPGAVINLGGDFISGALHDELAKTDALEPLPCVLEVVDILADTLRALADVFGKLYVPCVYGNHGRLTKRIEFKREHAYSLDWFIYQLLGKIFAADKRITIHAPAEGSVRYKVFGRRYLLMHGHELGVKGGDGIIGALGPIARGEVKVGRQNASIGAEYDLLIMGHWHQMLWGSRFIVANSLKGWDDYAHKSLRAVPSAPTQPLWFVHPKYGETSKWEIHCDDGQPVHREWCSIEQVRGI